MITKAPGVTANAVATLIPTLLSTKEAAKLLKCSTSFLAKKRLSGDGPSYIKIGRAVRYTEPALLQWMKSRQRISTSEA
jgi:predicted DNA-binding transcriptional regulator AlpA